MEPKFFTFNLVVCEGARVTLHRVMLIMCFSRAFFTSNLLMVAGTEVWADSCDQQYSGGTGYSWKVYLQCFQTCSPRSGWRSPGRVTGNWCEGCDCTSRGHCNRMVSPQISCGCMYLRPPYYQSSNLQLSWQFHSIFRSKIFGVDRHSFEVQTIESSTNSQALNSFKQWDFMGAMILGINHDKPKNAWRPLAWGS